MLQLLAPRAAWAQLGTGVLSGRVVDVSTQQPLADVVVTASSPALQGEQIVVTDSTGTFRIPNLPPGSYAVRYEIDGYHPYARSDVALTSTITLKVDAELLPTTLSAQEVTVVGSAPTVDVGSTRSGVTISNDFTSRVPVAPSGGKGGAARSFEQLAEIAPTARSDTYGASIAGTTSVENQYMIDGLSVGDPGFGYNGSPFSIEFIKETSILSGGYLPEYGRGGGGVLDVVTKSGSNEFHGSFFANITPWQGDPKLPMEQDAIRTVTKIKNIWDIGFDLGGPIVKDKLWFYVGADISQSVHQLDRDLIGLFTGPDGRYVYDSNGLIRSGRIPGTGTSHDASQTQFQYIAKLTYSPTEDDRIELTHRGTPSWSGGDGDYSIDYETGRPMIAGNPIDGDIIGAYGATAWKQRFDSFDTTLKWVHSALNKRLTFDTTIGWHNQRSADLATDGSELGGTSGLSGTPQFQYARSNPVHSITDFEVLPDPSVCLNPVPDGDAICPAPNYSVGGPLLLQDRQFNRLQLREVATYVAEGLGHHIVKAGFELELLTYGSERDYPSGVLYREVPPTGAQVQDQRRYGFLAGPGQAVSIRGLSYDTQSISFGGFLQDSWAIMDKVTLNAGARYDAQFLYGDQGLAVALPNQWSPRIGVIFDPTQSGASKLFANYAVYYQSIPLNIVDRAGSGEPSTRSRRLIANCDPNSEGYPASCEDPANTVRLGGKGPWEVEQNWNYIGIGPIAVDPDLEPPSSSEFSMGGEYAIIPNGRLGLTYIRRWTNQAIEDMSRDEANTYFLGNPGSGIATEFPEVERTYDAGILHFTKTFSELWLAQASYTLSYLRGNWDGLFRAQTNQLDPGSNSDFDLTSLTVNRKGPLDGDRRHEFKVFAARDIPFTPMHHLTVGASYRARSGGPTSYLGSHIFYGFDEVFILPRGEGPRLPWTHTVDAHLGYTFLRTEAQNFSVTCDIFNLFNIRTVTKTEERYTGSNVEPITAVGADDAFVGGNSRNIDPGLITPSEGGTFQEGDRYLSFGSPTLYQEPISIRLGIKSTF